MCVHAQCVLHALRAHVPYVIDLIKPFIPPPCLLSFKKKLDLHIFYVHFVHLFFTYLYFLCFTYLPIKAHAFIFYYEKCPKPTGEDRKINFNAGRLFYNTEVFKTVSFRNCNKSKKKCFQLLIVHLEE